MLPAIRPNLLGRFFCFGACLLLAACAERPLQRLSAKLPAGYQLETLSDQHFKVIAAMPAASDPPAARLRVYIEGDGHAWITPSQPSLDPTPRTDWFAELATRDPRPAVWLARPCQFVWSPDCRAAYWTDARFSEAVIATLDHALDLIKQQQGSSELELIGYSGGAAIALLLAARRNDVIAVQSLAGNLSPRRWAQEQGLTPLRQSLDPLDQRRTLQAIPQRHLVGERDSVIPSAQADAWRRALGGSSCVQVVHIAGADHVQGWIAAWEQWRETTPGPCTPDM